MVNSEGIHYAILESGISNTTTSTLLTDNSKSWTTNQYQNKKLWVNNEDEINIDSNNSNSLSYTGVVSTGSLYYFVYDYKCTIIENININVDILEDSDGMIV